MAQKNLKKKNDKVIYLVLCRVIVDNHRGAKYDEQKDRYSVSMDQNLASIYPEYIMVCHAQLPLFKED